MACSSRAQTTSGVWKENGLTVFLSVKSEHFFLLLTKLFSIGEVDSRVVREWTLELSVLVQFPFKAGNFPQSTSWRE